MKDKVSVIIPTYNREKTIKKAIMSCLNQTYKNIEVIVVDDCSTDNTKKVIDSIKDDRLKYIKLKTNSGACCARNTGIKKSTGKYIIFNDSDDTFRENKIEKQLNNLIKNKSDLDFCQLEEHTGDGKTCEFPTKKQEKRLSKKNILDELCIGNVISTQTILAKKSVFEDILFDENLPRLQDYDLVLRIACKYKISHTKEVLVDMYKQKNSISFSNDKLMRACIIMIGKNYNMDEDNLLNLRKSLIILANKDERDAFERELEKERKKRYEFEKKLDSVIRSKRWILINKLIPNRRKKK